MAGLVVLSTASPPAALAGGTPATGTVTDQLQTPGGGGAQAGVGDFISSTRGTIPTQNLDAPYRYFVEVPPGATSLEVEVFDADILAGAGDITGERDQNRNAGINTKTRYRLFDPDGNLVASRFNYGDDVTPSSSDNAWLLMYDNTTAGITGGDTFADNFGTNAYTNDDGNQNFATNWIESNDLGGAGATAGDTQVTGGELRLGNQTDAAPFANQPSVEREVDLSTYAAAVLTFDWRSGSGVDRIGNTTDIGDAIAVEASSDGGTTYEIIDEFAGLVGAQSGATAYDLTPHIASDTRVRLRITSRYAAANEFFFVDNFQIRATTTANGGSPDAGHWLVEVDLSGDVNGRPAGFGVGTRQDDVNAFGLRAHDGTAGSGGTEYNLYAHSFVIVGINNNDRGRDYDFYPYVTKGCDGDVHDFDFDADQPNPPAPNTNTQPFGSLDLTSRTGSFTHSNSTMSNDDAWRSENIGSAWNSSDTADDYGIWEMEIRIEDWTDNNYAPIYHSDPEAAAAPPTANPEANTYRLYFPTDANTAPAKPYLAQYLTYVDDLSAGANPPAVGETSRYAVSVLVTNPSGSIGDIAHSNTDVVTAHIPSGAETTYEGVAFVTSGSVVSQPSIGATTGDITWNPGTLSAGESETLVYFVDVTPAAVGDITVTGTAGTGDGTRATWLDETGDQTFTFGELCELEVATSPATPVLVSDFQSRRIGNRVVVEWSTAAEAETVSFDLYRQTDGDSLNVNRRPLLAQIGRAQGGTYRLVDETVSAGSDTPLIYWLAENEANGQRRFHGPFNTSPTPAADFESLPADGFESRPHLDPRAEQMAKLGSSRATLRATKDGRDGFGPRAAFGELALRVDVRESGLVRLTAAELANALGIAEPGARRLLTRHFLRLQVGDQEVPWRQVGRGEALEFYGQGLDSPYTDTNAYRLSLAKGLRMEVDRDPFPPTDWDGESFVEQIRAEQGQVGVVLMPLDPEGDTWFWDFLMPEGAHEQKSFPIDAPALIGGSTGELTLHLQGAAPGAHQLTVSLGAANLGQVDLSDFDSGSFTFPVPSGVLSTGINSVGLESTNGGLVFVDAFELTYERSNTPVDGRLLVRPAGPSTLTAFPFQNPDIQVLDLANPLRPRLLSTRVVTEPGGYRAIWRGEGEGPYLAVDSTGLTQAELAFDPLSDLTSSAAEAEYLVITTQDLMASAEALVDYRKSRGLGARAIDIQDIYDEMRAGVRDPRALREFLALAHEQWSTPPRYVVIAGAGHYDYRDYLGYGDNRVPPLLASNGTSLYASDSTFADFDGDGLPELAIGRLPAHNAEQLDAMVAKIVAREAGDTSHTVEILSDAADGDTVFGEVGAELAGLLGSGWQTTLVDLDTLSLADARQTLFDRLAEGSGWVHYNGHGGVDRLAGPGLLTSADVPGLDTGSSPPIVSSVTCHIGLHALPGFDSLGEHLLLEPGSGAAAVLGPTWLSNHGEAVFLGDRLFRQVFQVGQLTLGDAMLQAISAAAAVGADPSLLGSYQLLGDPALGLRMEAEEVEIPSDCPPDCSGPG